MGREFFVTVFFILTRYVHIVCTTMLVGGTLFYEMVVPIAIDDLRKEQQLGVFGRARWVFRRIVWWSAGLLLLSGAFSTVYHMKSYTRAEVDERIEVYQALRTAEVTTGPPGWWWAAHTASG